MSPTNKSLVILLISGLLFTFLVMGGQSSHAPTAENDMDVAENAVSQLNLQLNDNITAIEKGLNSLSYNAIWQSAAVVEWPNWLRSQKEIYQAAGLDVLGVYAKSNDTLYLDKSMILSKKSLPGQLGEFTQAIKRLFENNTSIKLIQLYKSQPSIVLMIPIRSIENEVIGSLIGIKTIDNARLKSFHYNSKAPVAILNNNKIHSISLDSNPDIDDFDLVQIDWPKGIQSSIWQLSLLVRKEAVGSSGMFSVLLALGLTFISIFLVWHQLRTSQSSLIKLTETLDIDLPIAEQIKRLTSLQNESNEVNLLDCSQAIRSRFEQLSQQKKAFAIEARKLQENVHNLKSDQKELTIERDTAVAAPRITSEFLSRMGDEITTPMKSVVSMLRLLSEYPFEPEPKQLLNIAKRSTRTLVDNLNNILDFSKLDAQMLKLKSSQFSVRELIDDLSSELSHFANEKELSLQASSDPDVPATIKADLHRIKQILRNLLGNAIRFTKSGEVSLYADTTMQSDKHLLRFTITDTGIGIPPDAQKGLFDSLQQTTRLSNSSFAGRLRLIVSKYLADLMGGEIGVISEIGKGSQFWFTVRYK
ncbi:MAG: signal transduction histidine kinase [Polaribacter sp.]|jgi:signal transduction histidine kinase